MSTCGVDIAELKAQVRLSSIVGQTVHLRRAGRELVGLCPFHAENTPSFYVSDDEGLFHCFGCGASGDVLTFIQNLENCTLRAAITIAANGWHGTAPAPHLSPTRDKGPGNLDRAIRIWSQAKPIAGTEAFQYLKQRKIDPGVISLQTDLRASSLWYPETRETAPCLVAAIRGHDGAITGIQRTYLTSGGAKASGACKRSLGNVLGGAIRLCNAETPLPTLTKLYVCEGLEDGLSILQLTRDAPVWVAPGAGFLDRMILPDNCRSATIGVDKDARGRSASRALAERLTAGGVEVSLAEPPDPHSDWNEYLMSSDARPEVPILDLGVSL